MEWHDLYGESGTMYAIALRQERNCCIPLMLLADRIIKLLSVFQLARHQGQIGTDMFRRRPSIDHVQKALRDLETSV